MEPQRDSGQGVDPCSFIEHPDLSLLYEEVVLCINQCTYVCFSNPVYKSGCWKITRVEGNNTYFNVWFSDCFQGNIIFKVSCNDIFAIFDCATSHCPFEPWQY